MILVSSIEDEEEETILNRMNATRQLNCRNDYITIERLQTKRNSYTIVYLNMVICKHSAKKNCDE